jgi:hypothetical protein
MFLFGRIRLTKCLYSGNKDAMTFILGALFFLLTFPCAVQVVYCLHFSFVKTDSFRVHFFCDLIFIEFYFQNVFFSLEDPSAFLIIHL